MKVALACSAGGHLTELLQIKDSVAGSDSFFLTFRREDSKSLPKTGRTHFLIDPKRNPLKFLYNLAQSIRVFVRERPDVVITTGAGVVIPFCYLAKLFRKRIIYLESFCRIKEPSATGRALYPIADLFLVQWPSLLKYYGPKAKYVGGVV